MGLGNVHSAEDPATLPLHTGACTGLLSEEGLLVFILHKNARPPVAATRWAHVPPPCQPPCQLALVLPLWQHWLHSPRTVTCFIWQHFPRNLQYQGCRASCHTKESSLCSNSSPPCLMWLTAAILPEKRSDPPRLWWHTGLGLSRTRTLSL